MKKLLFSVFALLAVSSSAFAQTVTVDDVEALPGETVTFALSLSDGKADTYTSLGFDVTLPEGIATTGTPGFSESWPGATGIVGEVTSAFASADAITGSAAQDFVSISILVDESVAVGNYDVKLTNIKFRYGTQGEFDQAPDVTFTVKVVSAHTVELDENATTLPASAEGVNVKVRRTISAGNWSTIVLPFSMTAEQTTTAFGSGVELREFSSWTSEEDEDGNITAINVGLTATSAIEANMPYLIKVADALTEFSAEGVDIDADDEPTVQVGKKKAERGYLTGTYVATAVPEERVFLSGGSFCYSRGLTPIKGFRAYFPSTRDIKQQHSTWHEETG